MKWICQDSNPSPLDPFNLFVYIPNFKFQLLIPLVYSLPLTTGVVYGHPLTNKHVHASGWRATVRGKPTCVRWRSSTRTQSVRNLPERTQDERTELDPDANRFGFVRIIIRKFRIFHCFVNRTLKTQVA